MKNKLKLAVMGGGNSSQAMAAELALAGFKVNLCDLPKFRANIKTIIRTKQIEKYGSHQTTGPNGLAKLEKVTTDVGDAIKQIDIILIAIPAYGHMAFFEALANKLEDGQIVVILPGNWGALRLFNLLKRMKIKKKIKIAETQLCMHSSRAAESWLGSGKVRVLREKKSMVQIAAMPAHDTETVFNIVKILFPLLTTATNVLETSLNNSNIAIHGPLVLMNAGWVEHTKGQFKIYRDGLTPSVGRLIDTIGDERDTILGFLGFTPAHKQSFYEVNHNAEWTKDPGQLGPPDLHHRYISEDIPYGLVPLSYLGDILDVATPVSDAMIELSSVSNKINYWNEGLTLEKLGLKDLKPEEILALVNSG